jgi:hypothetical protein
MRAVGYHYDAVKIFVPAGAKRPVYAPYVEHVPPDVTAQIFWLKNRDPAHWRDAWQMEQVTGKYIISDRPMTEEESRDRFTNRFSVGHIVFLSLYVGLYVRRRHQPHVVAECL